MRFTYNQYNSSNYDTSYRVPAKNHNCSLNNSTNNHYQHYYNKTNYGMRMTMSTASTMTSRIHRKGFRIPSKRHPGKAIPNKFHSMNRTIGGKLVPGKRIPQRPHQQHCDNSNDSGLGFDQHVDQASNANSNSNNTNVSNFINNYSSTNTGTNLNTTTPNSGSSLLPLTNPASVVGLTASAGAAINITSPADSSSTGNSCLHLQPHQPESIQQFPPQSQPIVQPPPQNQMNTTNSNSANTSTVHHSPHQHYIRPIPMSRFIPGKRGLVRVANKRQPTIPQNSVATSQNGQYHLEIISQPEQQHRARYQTEGSRGAVKDRSGNGFPIVRLVGYNKPAVMQVFIGTDVGRVAPHMFYQACKVAGKNSTQCNEKKVDGTMVIEIDFKPETEMTITCDCVGILKERNVDVEHRFPDHLAQKNKKKSTRCRMVFRTELTHEDGSTETLQVCSNPIICTQPPGVPEICKKSLNSCPVDGGLEMFIIGKNFLKDTQVLFQEVYDVNDSSENSSNDLAMQQRIVTETTVWQQAVSPDKEYLQQTHLICTVPPYMHQNIMKPVTVQVSIVSSGKKSESHTFVYTPKGSYSKLAAAAALCSTFTSSPAPTTSNLASANQDPNSFMDTSASIVANSSSTATVSSTSSSAIGLWTGSASGTLNEAKNEIDSDMMPPPLSTQMPLGVRRPSLNTNLSQPMITDQQLAHLNAVAAESLKTELLDESSQNSMVDGLHSPEVVAVNICSPHSPNQLQYHSAFRRKASMDSMMYETNSLPGYPQPATASTSTTQMEVAAVAAAIETGLLHAAVVQQQQQQQQQHQQTQQEQEVASAIAAAKVDKFITDLAKEASAVSSTAAPNPQASLFEVSPNVSATNEAFNQALNKMLAPQQSSNCLERSLSISSNSSTSNSNVSSPLSALGGPTNSPVSSMTSLSSPHTQDVLLNSESGKTLQVNTLPIQQILTNSSSELTVSPNSGGISGVSSNSNALTTEMIMNSSITPSSILCTSPVGTGRNIVQNILNDHSVSMANALLSDMNMQTQNQQAAHQDVVAALALSNIINGNDVLPSAANVAQSEVSQVTSTSQTVNNIIMKAAAEFISNHQEQQHIQQQQLQHQQQQQQLHLHHQQQMQNLQQQNQSQQHQHQIAQQHQPMLNHQNAHSHPHLHHHHHQQQQSQQQLLSNPATGSNVAGNSTTDTLVSLLLSHSPVQQQRSTVNSNSVTEVVSSPFGLNLPTETQPESLIVALAAENALQKSVMGDAAVVTTSTVTDSLLTAANVAAAVGTSVVGNVGAVTPLPPAIPQEITTMSDQDLISYINPSTFDQV